MQNSSVLEAHIHAIEKLERNGKWKVRGVEALDTLTHKAPSLACFGIATLRPRKGPPSRLHLTKPGRSFRATPL